METIEGTKSITTFDKNFYKPGTIILLKVYEKPKNSDCVYGPGAEYNCLVTGFTSNNTEMDVIFIRKNNITSRSVNIKDVITHNIGITKVKESTVDSYSDKDT